MTDHSWPSTFLSSTLGRSRSINADTFKADTSSWFIASWRIRGATSRNSLHEPFSLEIPHLASDSVSVRAVRSAHLLVRVLLRFDQADTASKYQVGAEYPDQAASGPSVPSGKRSLGAMTLLINRNVAPLEIDHSMMTSTPAKSTELSEKSRRISKRRETKRSWLTG